MIKCRRGRCTKSSIDWSMRQEDTTMVMITRRVMIMSMIKNMNRKVMDISQFVMNTLKIKLVTMVLARVTAMVMTTMTITTTTTMTITMTIMTTMTTSKTQAPPMTNATNAKKPPKTSPSSLGNASQFH